MQHHYFIGIKAPASIEELVKQYTAKYSLSNAYKVIPHLDDLHITLLFIGALSEQKVAPLQESLSALANQHNDFLLQVDGLSFFGFQKVLVSSTYPSNHRMSSMNCNEELRQSERNNWASNLITDSPLI